MRRHFIASLSAAAVLAASGAASGDGTFRIPRSATWNMSEPAPETALPASPILTSMDHSAGRLTVSFELMRIEGDGLSLPIVLSHTTGGLKAGCEDGPAGAAWELSLGGSVVRNIMGRPDEERDSCWGLPTQASSSLSQLRGYLEGTEDSWYDRYSFSAGEESGAFIVSPSGAVTHLIPSAAKVTKTGSSITIATPDGCVYEYEPGEEVEYSCPSINNPSIARNASYGPATRKWNLARITNPQGTDRIEFSYRAVSDENGQPGQKSRSYSATRSGTASWTEAAGHSEHSMQPTTHYTGRSRVSRIDWREGHIEFEGGSSPSCTRATVHDAEGNCVREFTFSYQAFTAGGRTRHLLTSWRAMSEGAVLDGADFSYCQQGSSMESKDAFGYCNSRASSQYYGGILEFSGAGYDRPLSLSQARAPSEEMAKTNSLISVETVFGSTLTLEYESSSLPGGWTVGSEASDLAIGLRVRSLALSDLATGEFRSHSYEYSGASSTIDFSRAGIAAYVSQGGSMGASLTGAIGSTALSQGATLLCSSRSPGAPLESAEIRYAKVVERISGTHLPAAVRAYEYDTSQAALSWVAGGCTFDSSDDKYLGITGDITALAYAKAFRRLPLGGYFSEKLGDRCPLVRIAEYRTGATGDTVPERVTAMTYRGPKSTARVGYHCESMVRTTSLAGSGSPAEIFAAKTDFEHFPVEAEGQRLFPWKTTVTEYAEDGTSRTIERVEKRNDVAYPLLLHGTETNHSGAVISYSLWKETVSCGGQSASVERLYSSDETSGILHDAALRGWTSLPTKTAYEFGSARAEREWAYSDANGGIRSVRETVRCGSDTLDDVAIARNAQGRPSSVVRNGGTPSVYAWSADGARLASSRVGALETSYSHKPLVGVESVTLPSGARRLYGYSAGRLATESAGDSVVRRHEHHLYCEGLMGNCVASTAVGGGGGVTEYSFYNGFGEETGRGTGAAAGDSALLSLVQYDALGRPAKKLRPVATEAGGASYAWMDSLASGQYGATAHAFSLLGYGGSCDSRPRSATIPGSAYASAPSSADYSFNLASASGASAWKACRKYAVRADGSLAFEGSWPEGTLEIETSVDGCGHVTRRYTDFLGQTVRESRCLSATSSLDTYYVYDDFGLLRYVLPPLASDALGSGGPSWDADDDALKDHAFLYSYDEKKRLAAKRAPGCGETRYRHDRTGALCFTQDAAQRAAGKCSFSFADMHGRTCLEGECEADDSLFAAAARQHVMASFSAGAAGAFPGYALNISPAGVTACRVIYYDSFAFLGLPEFQAIRAPALSATSGSHCAGLATGSLSRVLDSSSAAASWIASAASYDSRDRATGTVTTTADGGMAHAVLTLDNQDRVISAATRLYSAAGSLLQTALVENAYDSMGRISSTATKLNGAPRAFSSRAYGPDGALSVQALGSGLRIGYGYDTAGSLVSISKNGSPIISYTRGLDSSISIMEWQGSDGISRRYDYYYDSAARLTTAEYWESGRHPAMSYTGWYAYDANTNPLAIKRNGLSNAASASGSASLSTGLVDDLALTYAGGRLTKVEDLASDPDYSGATDFRDGASQASEMAYDECGRLVSDLNRGISSISYNWLGLPERISVGLSEIRQVYSADGTLLRRIVSTSTRPSSGGSTPGIAPLALEPEAPAVIRDTVAYMAPFVYRNGALDRTLVEGGYVKSDVPYYFLRDIQGSIRQVVDGNTGAVVQESHYYPYGGLFGESAAAALSSSNGCSASPYKFAGKEQVDLLDCSYLDFSARMYDYQLGRFHTMDPKMEETPQYSPYAYCLANPVGYVDPSGLMPSMEEAAIMADYVYGTDVKLIGGWEIVDQSDFNIVSGNGLKSQLFQRILGDGKVEYALAFAGTEFDDLKDMLNDLFQIGGFSPQYSEAKKMAQEIQNFYNDEITFVGHSLGGGLSAACAYAIGGQAVTFNPAGVSLLTQLPNPKARIDAYITLNDPLNYLQQKCHSLPGPDGTIHYVMPRNPVNGHSISNFYGFSMGSRIVNAAPKILNDIRSFWKSL